MNFDRVADVYDETRVLPEDALQRIVARIVEATHATPETEFLEIGIGTGRIAVPFIEAGYCYTGVDLSQEMTARLRDKVGDRSNCRLVTGDVTDLPFPDDAFDVVIAVHVLHLIPEWRKALGEVRRVLRPAGYFVMGGDTHLPGEPGHDIREQWRTLVEEEGASLRPRFGTVPRIEAEVTAEGGTLSVYRPAHWESRLRPIDLLEAQRNRVFSQSWDLPDDVLNVVHEKLLGWTQDRYGDPTERVTSKSEFTLSICRWPTAST